MLFGPEMLRLAQKNPDQAKKLKTNKLTTGGEWKHHLESKESWGDFCDEVINFVLEKAGPEHAHAILRLQKWISNIPAWHQGGKRYIKLYFEKYHCAFPQEADVLLLVKSNADARRDNDDMLAQLPPLMQTQAKIKALHKSGDKSIRS